METVNGRTARVAEKEKVRMALVGTFDSLVLRGGIWIGKRNYFYHHGVYTEQLEATVKAAVPGAVVISSQDVFKQWPAQSYLEVRFSVEVAS